MGGCVGWVGRSLFFKNECLSRSGVSFVGLFVQLRHHSQNYYNNGCLRESQILSLHIDLFWIEYLDRR